MHWRAEANKPSEVPKTAGTDGRRKAIVCWRRKIEENEHETFFWLFTRIENVIGWCFVFRVSFIKAEIFFNGKTG